MRHCSHGKCWNSETYNLSHMRISSLPTQKTWKIDAGPVLRLLFTAKCRQIISRNSSESGTFLSFFFQVWDGGLFYWVGKFNFDVRTPRSLVGIFFFKTHLFWPPFIFYLLASDVIYLLLSFFFIVLFSDKRTLCMAYRRWEMELWYLITIT